MQYDGFPSPPATPPPLISGTPPPPITRTPPPPGDAENPFESAFNIMDDYDYLLGIHGSELERLRKFESTEDEPERDLLQNDVLDVDAFLDEMNMGKRPSYGHLPTALRKSLSADLSNDFGGLEFDNNLEETRNDLTAITSGHTTNSLAGSPSKDLQRERPFWIDQEALGSFFDKKINSPGAKKKKGNRKSKKRLSKRKSSENARSEILAANMAEARSLFSTMRATSPIHAGKPAKSERSKLEGIDARLLLGQTKRLEKATSRASKVPKSSFAGALEAHAELARAICHQNSEELVRAAAAKAARKKRMGIHRQARRGEIQEARAKAEVAAMKACYVAPMSLSRRRELSFVNVSNLRKLSHSPSRARSPPSVIPPSSSSSSKGRKTPPITSPASLSIHVELTPPEAAEIKPGMLRNNMKFI